MLKKIVSAAALSLLATSAFAAGPVYGGLDIGSTKIQDFSGNKVSLGGFVGYSFNENFAVEGGFRHLGSWTIDGVDVSGKQLALSVIGSVPLDKQFSLFARLGYNRIDAEASYQGVKISDNTSGGLYGIGASYNIDANMAARVEVQKPASDTTNIGVSFVYKF